MNKQRKVLRCISLFLVFVLVFQLAPLGLLDGFGLSVSAVDVPFAPEGYVYDIPSASDNTIDAEMPETFIEQTTVNSIPLLSGDTLRYSNVLANNSSYSDLSADDAAFLCIYTGVVAEDFVVLDESNIPLYKAVIYADLALQAGCSVIDIVDLSPSLDECRTISTQLTIYDTSIDDAVRGTELDMQLRGHILQGYTCSEVLAAYAQAQVAGNKIQENLNEDLNYDLNSVNSSEAQIVKAITLADTTISTYGIGTDDPTEEGTVCQYEVAVPYFYEPDNSEKVSLNTGALLYESIDYVLPGRNSLDLVIGRRYNSQNASAYSPKMLWIPVNEYCYYVIKIFDVMFYYPDSDIWVDTDEFDDASECGPYTSETEATAIALAYARDEPEIIPMNDGSVAYLYYSAVVVEEDAGFNYYMATGRKQNDYLTDLYGLGHGWGFMFSSIEKNDSVEYLHLSTGNTYELEWSASNPSHIKDYELEDMSVEKNISEFSNGTVSSYYRLTYQGGKTEYFSSDGKLIGIRDRYGNTITLVHSIENGYPRIEITDTVGRAVVIAGEDSENGHTMTVTLPENILLSYKITDSGSSDGIQALSLYRDPVGQTTNYSYTIQNAGYNYSSKNTAGASIQFANLTTITHPTLAQTTYTYETSQRNLGYAGLMQVYKLSSREDLCGTNSSNQVSYTYTSDCSGYPTYSNPNSLPSSFTYSTTITDASGKTTTAVFNKEHLNTSVTIADANDNILQETLYEYNDNKLPIKTTFRQYGSAELPLETITAAEYDARGNVTAQWSSYALGDTTNTEYKTTYTYDSTYGLLLSQSYKTDANTTVRVQNTLDSTGKNIASTAVYVNDVLTQRTDFDYDSYGNISSTKSYHDNMTSYDLVEYTYQDGAYLTMEKHSGILTADGAAATSTPGQAAGVIATSYTYDDLGRLTSTTDGNGNTTSYAYDALGNITLQTNPDNTTVTYTRDYVNNTLTVTDENGTGVKYAYTPLGLDYETIDVQTNKVLVRNEYDSQSRLSKKTEYVYGGVTQYTYDFLDRVTSETVYQGSTILAQTNYTYDDATSGGYSKVSKTIVGETNAPSIVTTEYTDKHGKVVKTGKKLGVTEYFDTYTYDYAGNVLTHLTAGDAQKKLAFTAKYEYNENGQVVRSYNAENLFTTNTYNSRGQLVTATDYAGTPTTYTYDALGRLLSQTITISSGVTATSKYEYDANGNIIRKWKPSNAVGSSATWEKTEYTYDSRGRLTAVAQYNGSSVASATRYTYDGVGNTLSMTTGLSSLTATGGSTTSYSYDRFGNVLTTTDALGQTETSTYSELGKLTATTDRNGVTLSYTYDAMGRVLSETASDGSAYRRYEYTMTGKVAREYNADQLTVYIYDSLDRTAEVIESDGVIRLGFDANGGFCGVTSMQVYIGDVYDLPVPVSAGHTFQGWYLNGQMVRNGDIIRETSDCVLVAMWAESDIYYTITYNANYATLPSQTVEIRTQTAVVGADVTLNANRFSRSGYTFMGWSTSATGVVVYTNGQTIEGGLIPSGSSERAVTLYARWSRTAGGGVVASLSEDEVAAAGSGSDISLVRRSTYTYDLSDNVTQLVSKYGKITAQTVSYTYDKLNRLGRVSEDGTLIAIYTYDSNGNRASLTYTNGNVSTYTYNLANWVTGLSNKKGSTVISSYAYSYYASGNQKTETDNTGRVTSYTYDGLGRLTQESETGGITANYTYDARGNRTQLAVTGTESYTTNYTYDANNRLTQESKTEGEVVELTVYTYDPNGNNLSQTTTSNASSDAATQNYTYNGFNQQVTASVNGSTMSYAYNAQGIRVSKTTSSTTTSYILNGGDVIGEAVDGELTVVYLRGVNLISRLGTATLFYLFNAHGDVVSLTNTSGTSTKSYDYDAFGVERNIDEADANPFRYCGEYYDTETGTYYLRARYYDPAIGRFTQEDTHWSVANMIYGDNPQKINECEDALGLKSYSYAPQILSIMQAGNLYVYCVNEPLNFADPSGYVIEEGEVSGSEAWEKIGMMALSALASLSGAIGMIGLITVLSSSAIGVTAALLLITEAGITSAKAIYDLLALSQAVYYTVRYGGFSYKDYGLTGEELLDDLITGVTGNITRIY